MVIITITSDNKLKKLTRTEMKSRNKIPNKRLQDRRIRNNLIALMGPRS